jgi:hypothetical protein
MAFIFKNHPSIFIFYFLKTLNVLNGITPSLTSVPMDSVEAGMSGDLEDFPNPP